MDEPIRPRTQGERKAFLAGYAQAVLDMDERGLEDAREFLRLMVELDSTHALPGDPR